MENSLTNPATGPAQDTEIAALSRRLTLHASGADLPDDPLSAMLAEQMAAVHKAALRTLRRAEECAGEPETEALYARLSTRLLHLFQRQAKMLAQRREDARLDARAAEKERREAEEAERRREWEENRWDPEYEDDDFEEGGADEEIADEDIGAEETGRTDDAGQPNTAEICARLGALFTNRAAEQHTEAEAAARRKRKGGQISGNGPPP